MEAKISENEGGENRKEGKPNCMKCMKRMKSRRVFHAARSMEIGSKRVRAKFGEGWQKKNVKFVSDKLFIRPQRRRETSTKKKRKFHQSLDPLT